VGWNGTFLCVAVGTRDVPAAIERFFLRAGATLVGRTALTVDAWRADRTQVGIAISPAVSGWIGVADTERDPSAELARYLADALATPVVLSTIVEICDPPEPESIQVFGALPDQARFGGLYELVGFHYRHLTSVDGTVFLTFRGGIVRSHHEDYSDVVTSADDIPF
jgi:hypothetical protein